MSDTLKISVRVSGGVVCLAPIDPPAGYGSVEDFMADVQRVARLAKAAPEAIELLKDTKIAGSKLRALSLLRKAVRS